MIRLGELDYLNALPLIAWPVRPDDPPVQRVRRTPSELYQLLSREELDVTPISSIAYWRTREHYQLLPDLSISASGPVQSVTLYARLPLTAMRGATIGVTPASLTSVALLQLLLRRAGCEQAQLEVVDEPTLLAFPSHYAGILLIGDAALRARYLQAPAPPWEPIDLAEQWWDWQQIPMVFAVWVARRDWAAAHPAELQWIQDRLQEARLAFEEHPHPVFEEARARLPLSPAAIMSYYSCLDYLLTDSHRESLQRFGEMVDGLS